MKIDVTQIIIALITLVLIPTLELIFLKINKYIQHKIDNETVEKYVLLTNDIVKAAVLKINQTFVDELKSNGEFTEENAKIAFKKCKEIVVKQLTDDAKSALNLSFNDYNSYINALIEAEVNANKTTYVANEAVEAPQIGF